MLCQEAQDNMLLPDISKSINQVKTRLTKLLTSLFSILVEQLERGKQKLLLKKRLQLLQCSERKTKKFRTIANKFTLLSHIPFSDRRKNLNLLSSQEQFNYVMFYKEMESLFELQMNHTAFLFLFLPFILLFTPGRINLRFLFWGHNTSSSASLQFKDNFHIL